MAQTPDPHMTRIEGMIRNLKSALELAEAIKTEYEANGTDSLALIDYGAALNTDLQGVKAWYDSADGGGLFTAGWQPED